MDKSVKVIIGIIVIVLIVWGGVSFFGKKQSSEKPIKIGVILPLTGDAAFWGENAKNAILLAIDDVNQKGGVNGKRLEAIIENGQCDSTASVSAIKKLINVDKVKIVIGEVCSSATLAIAPIAESNKVILIAPCSEADAISNAGDYIFRTWTPNGRQAMTEAKYAINKLHIKKVAILSIDNDFGESLSKAFVQEFQKDGGQIVASEKYGKDQKDMRTQLTKVKAAQPEAVYLVSYQPDGVAAVKQMRELKLPMKILATSGINSADGFFKPLGQLAEGITFADLKDNTTPAFRKRYSNAYKKEWPGNSSCASVAYDDISIASEAVKNVGLDTDKIKDFFYGLSNFPGVSGPITFDKNGDLDREYSIFVVKNGQPELAE